MKRKYISIEHSMKHFQVASEGDVVIYYDKNRFQFKGKIEENFKPDNFMQTAGLILDNGKRVFCSMICDYYVGGEYEGKGITPIPNTYVLLENYEPDTLYPARNYKS